MATKKKVPTAVTIAPEKPVRVKKDGTPWAKVEHKRTPAELVQDYTDRLEKFKESAAATIKKYEDRIAYFKSRGTSKDDAAKEVLAQGMTLDQIIAAEATLRKAKAALKGLTPEAIEALRFEAVASKVPAFLAPVEDEEDESDDE